MIPYFYIIEHIPSNKFYAGSGWANGCHPDELLKEDGYLTSSTIINKLIKKKDYHLLELYL